MSTIEPFDPDNGDEGLFFEGDWCRRCRKYRGGNCGILARAFIFYTNQKGFPKQWVRIDGIPTCTAFADKALPYTPKHRAKKPTELQPMLELV